MMGKFNPNMWFFIPLFGLYLIFPLLWSFCPTLSSRKLFYFLVIILSFDYIIPYTFQIFHLKSLIECWYLNGIGISGFLCLAVAGWWLSRNEIPKRWRVILYVATTSLIIFIFFLVILIKIYDNPVEFSDNCPVRFVLPIAIFVFVKMTNWYSVLTKIGISDKLVSQLAQLSYGVYLIHYGVLVVAEMFHLHFYNVYVGFIPTYITSLAIAMLIKKTPYVCKILP